MDFFDNVKNAAQSAAHTVVKKSGEVVEYSKIKYAMFDTTNAIKNVYSEIGEAVYKSYKDGASLDENIEGFCLEIDSLSEKLEGLADQLGGIKASVKCGGCGKNVKEECTYCPYCGDKLAKDVDVEFEGAESSEYYSPSADDSADTDAE